MKVQPTWRWWFTNIISMVIKRYLNVLAVVEAWYTLHQMWRRVIAKVRTHIANTQSSAAWNQVARMFIGTFVKDRYLHSHHHVLSHNAQFTVHFTTKLVLSAHRDLCEGSLSALTSPCTTHYTLQPSWYSVLIGTFVKDCYLHSHDAVRT